MLSPFEAMEQLMAAGSRAVEMNNEQPHRQPIVLADTLEARAAELISHYQRRVQDLLETNNRYLERARTAEYAAKLFGPLGYLVVHPDLGEDEWTLDDDPATDKDESHGSVSIPLSARFSDLPEFVKDRLSVIADEIEESAS